MTASTDPHVEAAPLLADANPQQLERRLEQRLEARLEQQPQGKPLIGFKRIVGPVMLDVVGTTLNHDDARRIAHPLTGGVILFARNFVDPAPLSMLPEQFPSVGDEL